MWLYKTQWKQKWDEWGGWLSDTIVAACIMRYQHMECAVYKDEWEEQ